MQQQQPNELGLLRSDAQLYMQLKGKKQMLEDEVKELKKSMDNLEQSIVERMIASEFEKFTAGGYTFGLRGSVKASLPAPNLESFYAELRERDLGGIIKETINAQTLSGFVKDYITSDDGLPEWIEDNVSIYMQTKLSATKSKSKGVG